MASLIDSSDAGVIPAASDCIGFSVEKLIKGPPFVVFCVKFTRYIGYFFETAVADIIDNSVSAAATDIRILFYVQGASVNGDPVADIDPFLTRRPAAQPVIEQLLRINGEEIRVKPCIFVKYL